MVKVSITLPNNAQITFESEEPEDIPEMVGKVLRDLPRDLMLSNWAAANGAGPSPAGDDGNGAATIPHPHAEDAAACARSPGEPELPPQGTPSPGDDSLPARTVQSPQSPGVEQFSFHQSVDRVGKVPGAAEGDFIEFCRSANPLGDMRRVVVAAEGASRFLGTATVDADQLGRLFDLVAWPRPHSFTQTLRNAARSKFRWLERIPGRSGHYTVTDVGRATALQR